VSTGEEQQPRAVISHEHPARLGSIGAVRTRQQPRSVLANDINPDDMEHKST
jgi:hypothetical protein